MSPLVLWLLSEGCPATGEVFYARGGEIRRYAGWSYQASITADGEWDAADIDTRLGALLAAGS